MPRGAACPHLQVCAWMGGKQQTRWSLAPGIGVEPRGSGEGPLLTPGILPGEPGLLVAPVSQQSPFLGYAGAPELAQGKLLRDVFWPGDVYFNTGDLLVCDGQGFLHFHDRTGDTFRYLSAASRSQTFTLSDASHVQPHATFSDSISNSIPNSFISSAKLL